MRDYLKIKGKVVVRELPSGIIVSETNNLVVEYGIRAIFAMLGGGRASMQIGDVFITSMDDLIINRIRVGNVIDPDSAASTDVDLQSSTFYNIDSTVVEYDLVSPAQSVQISGVIPLGQMSDLTITEEGLYIACGKLFARSVITPFQKKANKQYQICHTLFLQPG